MSFWSIMWKSLSPRVYNCNKLFLTKITNLVFKNFGYSLDDIFVCLSAWFPGPSMEGAGNNNTISPGLTDWRYPQLWI